MIARSITLGLAAALAFAAAARADDSSKCPNVPQERWMSVDAAKAKAAELGVTVKGAKAEDGCWEVKGLKDGKRVELYLDPVSGAVVKSDDES